MTPQSRYYDTNFRKFTIDEQFIIPLLIDHGLIKLEEQDLFMIVIPYYLMVLKDFMASDAYEPYNVIKKVASHLLKIEKLGYSHHDITLMNIYVDDNKNVFIGDWGITVPTIDGIKITFRKK